MHGRVRSETFNCGSSNMPLAISPTTGALRAMSLGGLAESERCRARARTGEGRERAKARAVNLGRKPKLTLNQRREALKRRDEGEETRAEIARRHRVHPSRFRGSLYHGQ